MIDLLNSYLFVVAIGSAVLAGGFVIYWFLRNKASETPSKLDDRIVDAGIGIPVLLVDWKVNWLLSPFFLELPRSRFELVTDRLHRYKHYKPHLLDNSLYRYRHKVAIKLCNWLSKSDPNHCDKK